MNNPTATPSDQQPANGPGGPAFLFDLDGVLVDSVYQLVLAWREALEGAASSCRSGASTAAWA